MANQRHLRLLQSGMDKWNSWRATYPEVRPGLSGADLSSMSLHGTISNNFNLSGANLKKAKLNFLDLNRINLQGADLTGASLYKVNLYGANLSQAILVNADLSGADLINTNLYEADLRKATLTHTKIQNAYLVNADLREANLNESNLAMANLQGAKLCNAKIGMANLVSTMLAEADLSEADLQHSMFTSTNLAGANLSGCKIYGIGVWDVNLENAKQSNLVITNEFQPTITVDNLEVAQFIYLLLNNNRIRSVIDTITSKVVLILGRFTPERKVILEAIRDEIRKRNYLPVLFDFEKPTRRDITETISTLAHMSRFIIADITDANSIPQELQAIVPNLPSVPIQPLLLESSYEYGMFEHFKRYSWVLETILYKNSGELINQLAERVIKPAEMKAKQLERFKR
jgi:uncharacterized protein YjbI with pentapeptide repeats